MDEDRFLFAVYIVAPNEEAARDTMRNAAKFAESMDDEESFIDEWHKIERLGFSGDVFGKPEVQP